MPDLVLVRTRPCADFKSLSGQNNHFLITILVGLDAVKSGSAKKRPDFSTTWDPLDPARSAGRSRAYAIRTSLVWVTDLVNVYRRAAAKLPGVCTEEDLRRIQGDGEDGSSMRLERFARHLDLGQSSDLRLAQLAIHWRNRVAHSEATGNLDSAVRGGLKSSAALIADEHAGLDVEELIAHEARGIAPTFKEIASLMSACHKLVESLDRAVVERVDLSAMVDARIRAHLHDPNGPGAMSRTESLWGGSPQKTIKRLQQLLIQAGFQLSAQSVGPQVDSGVLEDLAALSLSEVRRRYAQS